jgi:hypothetical protein
MNTPTTSNRNALDVLRRMKRAPEQTIEKCDLCAARLANEHDHLIKLGSRQLLCACQACAVLFSSEQSARFRRVPRLAVKLTDFQLTDAQWDGLLIPINLAFFFFSSTVNRMIAVYPSPAGAMESLLELDTWQEITAANRRLQTMSPDVEGLLVNRTADAQESYLVSIDRCYELVGLIRTNWKGLSGGQEVWQKIRDFFEHLGGGLGIGDGTISANGNLEAPSAEVNT